MGSKVPAIRSWAQSGTRARQWEKEAIEGTTPELARPPRTVLRRSQTVHEVLGDAQVIAAELALAGEERLADQARALPDELARRAAEFETDSQDRLSNWRRRQPVPTGP
jgi:hypothetical protein